MKVQEILENYNSLKVSVTIAIGDILTLKREIGDIKSTNLDGMPKAKGYTSSNLEEQVINVNEKIEKKQSYINQTTRNLEIVEGLVKTLKKYNQDIIDMRFYQMMSIEEIATKKNRNYGSIQKTIDRSIKIMQKEYNKYKMS